MNAAVSEEMPISEYRKLPYVEHLPSDGRAVVLRPYYDHEVREWFHVIPVRPGELGRMADGEVRLGSYFSTRPVDSSRDIEFPLGTLISQHLSVPELVNTVGNLEHRVLQFAVSLEQYGRLVASSKPQNDVMYLLSGVLEYVVITVRSVYDLIQHVACRATKLVKHLDDPYRRLIQDLPERFSKVILHGSRIRTLDEIVGKLGLPEPIAGFYVGETEHFVRVRSLRNAIVHDGETPREVYQLQRGAAVGLSRGPWRELPIWEGPMVHDDRFGSLQGLIAYLAGRAIDTATLFASAYASCVRLPQAIGPDVRLYLRHPFGARIVAIRQVLQRPWEDDSPTETAANVI